MHLAALLGTLLAVASPAHAILTWEASGGWNFGGTNSFGGLTQPPNPPALVTSGGDFSNGGALCPALGTPNYICGSYYGKAELVGFPGGVVRMHASARLRQKDATGTGFVKLVYGGARVWFIGVTGAVASPVVQAVFNFGLHGTRSESTNHGDVTVEAKGVAFLVADKQYFVQCFADVCQPIKVPISSNWDPGAPGGTAFYVDLRTDARITAPLGATFDAEAIADYEDTLEIVSIQLQDENDQDVPGVQLVVNDNMGQPIYTFANTPPTTTSTTLVEATTTTSTSTPGTTVTTTTLPPECSAAPTFTSVGCRLATLLDAVQATADGPVAVKLVTKVSAAQQAVTGAEQLATTSRKRSSKSIGKALKALAAYQKLLKSRAAKQALDDGARAALAAPLAALRADLKALRKS